MFAKAIQLPVGELTFWRSVFAAGCILLFLMIKGLPVRAKSKQDFFLMVGLGLCLCLHWLTYFQALNFSQKRYGNPRYCNKTWLKLEPHLISGGKLL